MTTAEELALWEAAYQSWLEAGCPESYSGPNGQSVTRNGKMFIDRIDQLRANISRETSGGFQVAQFRDAE